MRNGDFKQAIADIQADTTFADSGVKLFKLGVAYSRAGDAQKALFCLRLSAQRDERIAPLAYEMIGDECAAQHQVENAIHAYRAAQSSALLPRHAAALRKKMYGVLRTDSTLAAQISWFQEEKPAAEIAEDQWILQFLDTLLATGQWALADSIITICLDTSARELRCSVCDMLADRRFPDSLLNSRRLFDLSRLGLECKLYQAARMWLDSACERRDFPDSVSDRAFFLHSGLLEYARGNYASALKWLDKHEKKFGLTPQIVLTVARSYRRLNKMAKSDIWYDKLIEMYPSHPLAGDALWYRAWRKEEDGRYDEAARRYTAIYQRRPRGSQADQAYFRSALCQYKQGTCDAAAAAFGTFAKRRASSPLATAAQYWRARSLAGAQKKSQTMPLLQAICAAAPWDYYAFRSRELLFDMGDTSQALRFDSSASMASARAWLDSIQKPETLSAGDSLLWFRGVLLALSGMPAQAEIFLRPLEMSYHKNLALQFDLAVLYDMCGDPTLSFRVSRRLSWRIGESFRARLPITVYGMLYPLPFQDMVVEASLRHNVDPLLVCAVMRQESIFDPAIVSPAGAVGLMQIMPFTGKSIASSLEEKFSADSLYSPALNIRYGAWYLRQLLDQFGGDIACAAAGYNGGPHNVELWRMRNRDTPQDLFVENIGFSETREYVKKVLANYWTYKKLAPALGYPGAE